MTFTTKIHWIIYRTKLCKMQIALDTYEALKILHISPLLNFDVGKTI